VVSTPDRYRSERSIRSSVAHNCGRMRFEITGGYRGTVVHARTAVHGPSMMRPDSQKERIWFAIGYVHRILTTSSSYNCLRTSASLGHVRVQCRSCTCGHGQYADTELGHRSCCLRIQSFQALVDELAERGSSDGKPRSDTGLLRSVSQMPLK
jgi:hypothetical protein